MTYGHHKKVVVRHNFLKAMFNFTAIKALFSFGAASQKDQEAKAKQKELDGCQLAHDQALVHLSKLLHECQLKLEDKQQRLARIWDEQNSETVTDSSFDSDATVLDSDLSSLKDDLNTLTRRERVLQSEIYFKLRECQADLYFKLRKHRAARPSEIPEQVDEITTHEGFFRRFATSLAYARRWLGQFFLGALFKVMCFCLMRK